MDKNVIDVCDDPKTQMISLVNLSMDKYVEDILSLSMDKNVEDILSKSQYGQKHN